MRRVVPRILALGLLVAFSGCYEGTDADPSGASGGSGGEGESGEGGPNAGACEPDQTVVSRPLQRLSSQEYRNTLQGLVGPTVLDAVRLEVDAVPADARVSDGLNDASGAHVDAYAAVAAKAAVTLVADPALLAGLGYPCLETAAPDEACVRSFIETFGLLAHRHPLTAEHADDLYAFYADPGDHDEGLVRLIMRLLLAPQMLFHVETGGELQGEDLKLDDYSVANRIAYRLLGSAPRAPLLAAAAAGELRTVEQLDAWAETLLDDPAAQEQVQVLFDAWMEVAGLPVLAPDDPLLQGLEPVELRAATLDEFTAFVQTLLWEQDATFSELMTSTQVFPASPALAELYGVPVWTPGESPPTAADRPGLLLRAGAMALDSNLTAPILRGVFLLREVLCSPIATPGVDIINSRLEDVDEVDRVATPTREAIETITEPVGCQACHAAINPLAFAMQDFDALGRSRTVETVVGEDAQVLATHDLDTKVAISLPETDSQELTGSRELVAFVAELSQTQRCFSQRVFEFTRARPAGVQDTCAVDQLLASMAEGDAPLRDLFAANIANEQTLWRRVED